MLNFLNLKSFPTYLFFVLASSLSILCGLGFDFSNPQNLEIGSTSEEKKREVFFAWDKEEQEGWLIKIERTLKVS